MKKAVIGLFVTITIVLCGISLADAQSSPEQLRAESIARFKKWREDIPDYEYRLYERVRDVNRRVISSSNMTMGLIVILFLAAPFWFRLALRKQLFGGLGTSFSSGEAGSGTGALAKIAPRQLAKLKSNQVLLFEMLSSIEGQIRSSEERMAALDGDRQEMKAAVGEMRRVIESVSSEIGRLGDDGETANGSSRSV